MAGVHGERWGPGGRLASVSQDGDLIRRSDARLVPDEPEASPPGDAGAGRILQGVGWAQKPWPLPPPVCAHNPLALRCRAGARRAGHAFSARADARCHPSRGG